MPAVRAHMVFAALGDHGEIIGSVPTPDAVEQFEGRQIEAWIASDHEDETIADNVRSVSEVFTVEVKSAEPEAKAAPAPAPVPVPLPAPEVESAPQAEATPAPTAEAKPAPTPAPAVAHPAKAPVKTAQTRTVRVDAERLDALMHSMGELVIHRTAVEALTANIEARRICSTPCRT